MPIYGTFIILTKENKMITSNKMLIVNNFLEEEMTSLFLKNLDEKEKKILSKEEEILQNQIEKTKKLWCVELTAASSIIGGTLSLLPASTIIEQYQDNTDSKMLAFFAVSGIVCGALGYVAAKNLEEGIRPCDKKIHRNRITRLIIKKEKIKNILKNPGIKEEMLEEEDYDEELSNREILELKMAQEIISSIINDYSGQPISVSVKHM